MQELQEKLIKSFEARALAVFLVTSTSGSKTPGVDKVVWDTPAAKYGAIHKLTAWGNYKSKNVRNVHIPKSENKKDFRTLAIPTLNDRAVHSLAKLALEPIAEVSSDDNS